MEINNAVDLKQAIALLEKNIAFKKQALFQQYHIAFESMKPANLIKSSIRKYAAKPGIINKIAGIGASVLFRKIIPVHGAGLLKSGFIAALKYASSKLYKKKRQARLSGPLQEVI